MNRKTFRQTLMEDILQNRKLTRFVLFLGVLCFGFTVTNFSIGVDDPARNYYLYSKDWGSMIQQGRLMHVVFNALTGTVEFIPFFTEFLGAVLYCGSSLLFCALFQYITDGKLPGFALAGFCGVYISSSILAEKFIYQLDVIVTMLSYAAMPLALLYAYRFVKEHRVALLPGAAGLLMVAIGSYESFICLYVCCVFAIFLLELVVCGQHRKFGELLAEGLQYAAILALAAAVYYGLVYLMQAATGQLGIFHRFEPSWAEGLGLMGIFMELTRRMYQFFAWTLQAGYLPIQVFCLCCLLGAVLCLWYAIKQKNLWLLLCYLGLFAANFPVHYAMGSFTSRTAQTFCFFTGFVILLVLYAAQGKAKPIVCAGAALLIFVQAADMNRWFYNDYIRYKKEAFVIDSIATQLAGGYDLSKPVVFVNTPDAQSNQYLATSQYPGGQANGLSVVYWASGSFSEGATPMSIELFRMHGYDFLRTPTLQQYEAALPLSEEMPAWPQAGAIQEFDDFILVNIA